MYFYQFHIGDYRTSTGHLTNEEDLAYRRLLDLYYMTEKPIPLDLAPVARKIKSTVEIIERLVSDKLFYRVDDGYHNKRCDEEIYKYQQQVKYGRRGAEKRWGGNREPIGGLSGADGGPTTGLMPNQEPRTKNQEPRTNKENTAPDKPARHARVSISRPESVEQEVWESFMAQCKAKQKPATAGVMKKIEAEATAAAISLNDALRWSADKGYARFEAEWYLKENPRKVQEKEEVEDQEEKARVEEAEKKRWLKKRGLA